MFIQHEFTVRKKGEEDSGPVTLVISPFNLILGLANERLVGADESDMMSNTLLALLDKLEKDKYEFLM